MYIKLDGVVCELKKSKSSEKKKNLIDKMKKKIVIDWYEGGGKRELKLNAV